MSGLFIVGFTIGSAITYLGMYLVYRWTQR